MVEDEVLRIIILMQNFVPSYKKIIEGDWKVATISYSSYDLERNTIGTIGSGRIGKEIHKHLKVFLRHSSC